MPKENVVAVGTALAVLRRVNLLSEADALALDIGGSLAKLLYLQPDAPPSPPAASSSAPLPRASQKSRKKGKKRAAPPPRPAPEPDEATPPRELFFNKVSVAPAMSVPVPSLRGRLHFFAFETAEIAQLVSFMSEHWVRGEDSPPVRRVRATGGGSFKYAALFEDEIGVRLVRRDEMACVVAGLNFLLTAVDREVYSYVGKGQGVPERMDNERRKFVERTDAPFPYLLVNIGSGVSIVKVTGHGEFERVSGSTLGGGTFWGLARMLLNCRTFDEVIGLTKEPGADSGNVDMLVGDVYGGAYDKLGLGADVIAASFGKVTMRHEAVPSLKGAWRTFLRALSGSLALWVSFLFAVPMLGAALRALNFKPLDTARVANPYLAPVFAPRDVALALLRMVSYNIGQIAYLNARLHGMDRIYFGGNFIRDHPYTIAFISFAVDFWSAGKTQALFMKHDGYLGAIGAFLASAPEGEEEVAAAKSAEEEAKGQTAAEAEALAAEAIAKKKAEEAEKEAEDAEKKAADDAKKTAAEDARQQAASDAKAIAAKAADDAKEKATAVAKKASTKAGKAAAKAEKIGKKVLNGVSTRIANGGSSEGGSRQKYSPTGSASAAESDLPSVSSLSVDEARVEDAEDVVPAETKAKKKKKKKSKSKRKPAGPSEAESEAASLRMARELLNGDSVDDGEWITVDRRKRSPVASPPRSEAGDPSTTVFVVPVSEAKVSEPAAIEPVGSEPAPDES